MILPVQITFRNGPSNPEVEADIAARVRKLEQFYRPITSCRVLVEAPARHRQKGYPYHVRIDLTVPDGEIVVSRAPALHSGAKDVAGERAQKKMETKPEHKHLKVAISEAFSAARRQLQDHARKRRVDVKTHIPMSRARVMKLFPAEDYGYLETPDGREVYFHANSVLNERFKDLKLGSSVSFTDEAGEKGPQATTVHVITRARAKAAPTPVRR